MAELPYVQIPVLALALLLGAALALSFKVQASLQRSAVEGDHSASGLKRLCGVAVTLGLLVGAVLAAKHLSYVIPRQAFMATVFVAALSVFLVQLRSNILVERTGQKRPAAYRER